MSAEIINLRLARKRRARAAKEADAAQNRLLSGETKAERRRQRRVAERAERDLDAHKRDLPAYPPGISDESWTV